MYILYRNVQPFGGSVDYLIDIGSEDGGEDAKLTGPMVRVSEPKKINEITYRELKSSLVYFELESPLLNKNSEIAVKVKFKDNFPAKHSFRLGAHNKEGWNWHWKNIYVPFYESELENFWLIKENNSLRAYSTHLQPYTNGDDIIDFLNKLPEGTVIATDTPLNLEIKTGVDIEKEDYEKGGSLVINTTLREAHTLYIYIGYETLNFTVTKQDLNWYNGTDELEIAVFDLEGKLLGNITIPDDGIVNNTGERGKSQTRNLTIQNLERGAYRVDLKCTGDLLITKVETEQSKLVVANRLFLVGNNPGYFKGQKTEPIKVYFKNFKEKNIEFLTYHECGLQNITINGTIGSETIVVNEVKTWFNTTMKPSDDFYELQSEKEDIIIKSNNYFSFTKSSYFIPKKYEIMPLQNSMDWIEKNGVEYIVIEYQFTEEAGDGWKVGSARWNTRDLYIEDNKLSFVFNIPHLEREEFKNHVIPIDWIKITITTPPRWERT